MVLDHNGYPEVTLFMLMSLDGKISTGHGDRYDVDKDLLVIQGAREGLHQYYKKEQETDLWSLVTGKTLAKIGVNDGTLKMERIPNFHRVVLGVRELTATAVKSIVDSSEYAHFIVRDTIDVIKVGNILQGYPDTNYTVKIVRHNYTDPKTYLRYLKSIGCDKLTLQAGATVNGAFAASHCIDTVHVIVAPVIIGGSTTPTLIDGMPRVDGLEHINVLKLISATPLQNSYLELVYDVIR